MKVKALFVIGILLSEFVVFGHSKKSMTVVDPLVVARTTLHEKHPEWFGYPLRGLRVEGIWHVSMDLHPMTLSNLEARVHYIEQQFEDVHMEFIEYSFEHVCISFSAIPSLHSHLFA
jgi:hypothetical protein